ncbi:MAG: dTDP-4-dehydrorhamnose reductase [Chloroflexi bacterium]|nr:MAG: dTDP-4-dehydrorhamnose reductase [Chloroflexota bacterium]
MKVLLTGAEGMLARDLQPCLRQRGHEVFPLSHSQLDITKREAVRAAVNGAAPALIINCAAYNKVDDAETQEDWARAVNGLGVQNLCLACQDAGIPLVHFSTDYVFDGTQDSPYSVYDRPNPISAYGRSKLLGEQYVLWLLNRFYLVRTSWLFGLHGANFVETMLKLGSEREQVSVVNDQRGCPTWTQHLAEAVVALLDTGCYGVYHVTNSDSATWFEFAREVYSLSGMSTEAIPVTTEQLGRPAPRPHNSVLDPFPIPQVLGRELPTWKQALAEYLARRKALARQ